MKVSSIEVTSWSNGRLMISLDNSDAVHVTLTEEESERVRQLALEIFTARQQAIAKEIADAKPAMLCDFTEVEPAPVEVSF